MRATIWLMILFVAGALPAAAQERVTVPSLAGTLPVPLDGYLFRPAEDGARHPAVVFLHGCGGLLTRSGAIVSRERSWAERLVAAGDVVLAIDSFTPRGVRSMCAPANFVDSVYRDRPFDAYGALRYLQAQSFVQPDRIAVMGWSEGGGTTLFTIAADSPARPASLPQGDFRAAVAFYPASCNVRRLGAAWTTRLPLFVLVGAGDVWTPPGDCQQVIDRAAQGGAAVSIHIYPDSYHDFDWPGMRLRERPEDRTLRGVIPITGTNEVARADALQRVPAFLAAQLMRP